MGLRGLRRADRLKGVAAGERGDLQVDVVVLPAGIDVVLRGLVRGADLDELLFLRVVFAKV